MKRKIRMASHYLAILGLFIYSSALYAQQHGVLQGRIIERGSGKPIENVTVRIHPHGSAVKSNGEGTFTLRDMEPRSAVSLRFSLLGYGILDTLLNAGKGHTIMLSRTETALEEVSVSTGYDNIPRERATGSFAVVGNDRISEQINFNIMDRLPAVTSGLALDHNTKAGSNQLMVRGMGTILGETAPLIVLDNFPYEGDLSGINPDDIETVTVLRDAAAASIWGARSGNGVIVITSKKGAFNRNLKIDVSSVTSLQEEPDLFAIDRVRSTDMIDIEQLLFDKGYYNSMISSKSRPVLSPAVELFIARASATDASSVQVIEEEIARLRTLDVRDDFQRYMYRTGLQQQSTISLSQGAANFAWNASVGNGLQFDNLDSRTHRNNFLMNSRLDLGSRLSIETGVNIAFRSTRSGRPGYGDVSAYNGGLFPYAEFADADGNALPVYKDWRASYLANDVDPILLDWKYYPLEDYKHAEQTQQTQNSTLSTAVTYRLPKWFRVSVRYQFQSQTGSTEYLRDSESYDARNTVNSYAKKNATTGLIEFKVPKGGIFDQSNDEMRAHNIRGQINFDWQHVSHAISGLIGAEVRGINTGSRSNRLYGYNQNNLSYSLFDLTVPYTHYITGANSYIPTGIGLKEEKNRYISVFFNGSYTLKDRYTATLSARRDASNLFGLNINDKWNPFWSAGLAWTLSKESFWKTEIFSQFKIRATYGKTGNVDPSMVALTTIEYIGPNTYTQTPYARFDNYANPELQWEAVNMGNVAIDFSTKNSRISGSIEAYQKNGRNLYGIAPVDYTAGIGSYVVKNVASMSARGLDLELNTINTTGRVRWASNLNFSMNSDKVTKYHLESNIASQFVMSINPISGRENSPVYSMYSYKWMGLDPADGAPLGLLAGEVSRDYQQITGADATVDDLVYHGSILPRIFGSFGNTLNWRQWSTTFRVTYKFDYYFRRQTIRYSSLFSTWDGHGDYYKRWQKPGDEAYTSVPALTYPVLSGSENFYPYAEPFVERGDHIRLEYVNLSYHLAKKNRAVQWLKDATITFNITNLGLLYRKNSAGIDPDYSSAANTGYSPAKTYSISIKCIL